MIEELKNPRTPDLASARPTRRFGWVLVRIIAAFLFFSVAQVVIFKFVPVPVTLTMLMDPFPVTKKWVPLQEVDRDMVDAVISGEDGKFCLHNGFDHEAMMDAFRRNQRGGRIRGGSTISQQTAKNVFLWQGGGYFRKGLEAWYTVLIETIWGKRRIMEVYLNVAETGIGTYGVEAGAQRYYGKSARSLTPVEAARIAAVLPLPKKREVNGAGGFTRRHGNAIARRVKVVKNEALDSCVYR
ncbi:MAG: monofunctional biosynthetic peptidoglycan transglycosylase [Novosphingobium meiothermophilum]|uniref:monofunctional biosynthetic peptidoglycan transglycosylase n=1 Tax=Novosphingobium TaxID=165696 RepID=UPI000D6E9872|nr:MULTISPECIES: monofunctional biosynthetic peptidoglycan transglycosylase [Novosphingobium]